MPDKDDFTAKLMDDMPEHLLKFVKSKINSFIKWDLVRFFYENPHTMDTIENIAKYAGRALSAMAPELEELEASGIMTKKMVNEQPIYFLTEDEEMRSLIKEFIEACESRHFHVKAIHHIIRGMQ